MEDNKLVSDRFFLSFEICLLSLGGFVHFAEELDMSDNVDKHQEDEQRNVDIALDVFFYVMSPLILDYVKGKSTGYYHCVIDKHDQQEKLL